MDKVESCAKVVRAPEEFPETEVTYEFMPKDFVDFYRTRDTDYRKPEAPLMQHARRILRRIRRKLLGRFDYL